jgi:hypothetical protein
MQDLPTTPLHGQIPCRHRKLRRETHHLMRSYQRVLTGACAHVLGSAGFIVDNTRPGAFARFGGAGWLASEVPPFDADNGDRHEHESDESEDD